MSRTHPDPEFWNRLCKEAIERDKCCRSCASEKELHVYHITYKRFGREALGDVTTLCKPCSNVIATSINARINKDNPVDIFEEVQRKGADLKAITDVLQRHDDLLSEMSLILDLHKKSSKEIREQLNDGLSETICNIVESSTQLCTAEYIHSFVKDDFTKQTVNSRLRFLVEQGILKTKPLSTYKRGRPPIVYTMAIQTKGENNEQRT